MDMIVTSPVMQSLFRKIGLVAHKDIKVLIRGERGTGKELVAWAIHKLSRRSKGIFKQLNCAGLPKDLFLSELFGHEKGAFTGAYSKKVGLVEECHQGTLLLDEIGDLSPEAQTGLLRFLQEGEVRPLGSSRIIKVDVRIISATNQDL